MIKYKRAVPISYCCVKRFANYVRVADCLNQSGEPDWCGGQDDPCDCWWLGSFAILPYLFCIIL